MPVKDVRNGHAWQFHSNLLPIVDLVLQALLSDCYVSEKDLHTEPRTITFHFVLHGTLNIE